LVYRQSAFWHVESIKQFGSNVISFQLVTGCRRIYRLGGYIPPTDVSMIKFVNEASNSLPRGPKLVLGDLNADLNNPRNERTTAVVTAMADLCLKNLYGHFCHKNKHREVFTCQIRRGNKTIKTRCDYILGSERGILTNIQLKDSRHYTSDHFMVVLSIFSAPKQDNASYLKARKKFHLCMNTSVPQTKANSMFQGIKSFVEKVRRPAQIWTSWISETTWQMIDRRAAIRKNYKSQCIIVRTLSRRIAKAIKADWKQRTNNSGEAIEYMLKKDKLKGVWSALKAWYKHAYGRGCKPSHDDLDKLEAEYKGEQRRLPLKRNC
jgi:hypothetical protein